MTEVPARLVYTDSGGTEQTIGEFRPQDPTEGLIGTFTLEENAYGYKRAIIEGGFDLREDMPVLKSEFQNSEPEIFVEIDENNDGTYTTRMRVFPEGGGSELDNGRYKHENLWGFKKQLAGDKVDIGPITGTIVDVVENTLPSGYTVQYPGDETPPNVYEYTANDARQQIWQDIQEDYGHIVEFTPDTDGNGDYIVNLQPFGYGGVQFVLRRREDPIMYDYWRPQQTSEIVSEVQVVGTTDSGEKIDITRTPADYVDLDPAERERFKRINVGYLAGTTTEAEEMADDIAKANLNPLPSDDGALETDIKPQSNINDTIGLVDNEKNTDDNYTVVKQKDYLHEGITYLSLEFEEEESRKVRRKFREVDSERAAIYPSSQTDVGSQTVSGNTNSDNADLNRDQDTVVENTDNSESAVIRRDPNTEVNEVVTDQGYFAGNYSESPTTDGTWTAANTSYTTTTENYLFHACFVNFEFAANAGVDQSRTLDVKIRLYNIDKNEYFPNSTGVNVRGLYYSDSGDSLYNISQSQYLHAPFNWTDDTYRLEYNINSSNLFQENLIYSYHGSLGHSHNDDIEVERGDFNVQQPSVITDTDIQAGVTTQPIFTDNGHFHALDVSSSQKLIDLFTENKTDR